jgi:hypothetical protein
MFLRPPLPALQRIAIVFKVRRAYFFIVSFAL